MAQRPRRMLTNAIMPQRQAQKNAAADELQTLFTSTVLTQIRELIVTGELPPGTHLAAEPIASRLGVSRTPVRNAFSVLLAEGLLEHSVNRGFSVREIPVRDILGAIDMRAVIEARGCGMSIEYGWSPEELATLDERIAAGREIVDRGAWSAEIERQWYEINRDIHAWIVRVGRNPAIRSAMRMTLIYPIFGDVCRLCPSVSRYVPLRNRQIPSSVPDHIVESQAEHEAIADAIRADDAEEAERLMHQHVIAVKHRVLLAATRR